LKDQLRSSAYQINDFDIVKVIYQEAWVFQTLNIVIFVGLYFVVYVINVDVMSLFVYLSFLLPTTLNLCRIYILPQQVWPFG